MTLQTGITQEQQQLLSTQQIQSLHILSMPAEGLIDFLQKESEENPFMEYQPCSSQNKAAEYLNFIAAPEKDRISTFILDQLNLQNFTKSEWALLKFLSQCIDEKGYLTITRQEIRHYFPVSEETIQHCLNSIQGLQPAGLGASSLPECLKLQLQSQHQLSPLLSTLLEHYLADICENKITTLCKTLHVTNKEIRAAIKLIKSLHPVPLKGFFEETTTYIIPDIVIRSTEMGYEITLNDSYIEPYSLSDHYLRMMKETADPNLKEYFQEKYTRCAMIFHNIERRRQTLRSLAAAIWDWQHDYFQHYGVLRPMTLKDISEKTNLHVSTISRAIKNKYLQTPNRTTAIKDLFRCPLKSEDKSIAKDTIQSRLKDLVDHENPAQPYSDSQLMELLSQEYQIPISRRVIQKYRNILHIANSYERKI